MLRAAGCDCAFRGCDCADWSVGARSICRDDAPPGRIRYGDAPCCRARLSRGCHCADWSAGARPICRATLRRGASGMARLRAAGATVPWVRLCRLVCRGAADLPGRRSAGGASGMAMLRAAGRDCPVGATVPIGLPGRGRSAGRRSAGVHPVWRYSVLPGDARQGRIRYGDTPCCRGDRSVGGCDCADWSAGARPICRDDRSDVRHGPRRRRTICFRRKSRTFVPQR